MIELLPDELPARPRLRPVEAQWIEHGGQELLLLRDRLGIAPGAILVPAPLAPLLALCDGTRDQGGLRAAYALRGGLPLAPRQLESLLRRLNAACLFEGPRYEAARQAALGAYRAAPHRPPALAPHAYPDDPAALAELFAGFADEGEGGPGNGAVEAATVRGIVSPHIDYARGGAIYARTWARAAEAVRQAEVVVLLGTDHCGSGGRITLTRQHYATPYGVLPTDREAVAALARALGEAEAFAEELHHRNEHSIELAAVWLHHVRGGQPCRLLPVLCGSFHPFIGGEADPAADERLTATVETLRAAIGGRRALVVAAGDLAHVGPAFGDARHFDPAARERLQAADAALLAAICAGDADAFFDQLRAERDERKVCGLPPIYLMLRLLGDCQGELVGYQQCPADAAGASWVTIGGVLMRGT